MSPRISNEIQHYGARLTVEPDPKRPWSIYFVAMLNRRIGKPVVGIGNSPIKALEDLDTKLATES
jgi:hypothetical protein